MNHEVSLDSDLDPSVPARTTASSLHQKSRVLLVTVPSDAHMWNMVFLELLITENGHAVTNLGHCTPVDETVRAAVRGRPDVIVVSTVNGHGHLDGARLIRALRARPELADMRVVIGGKLGIDGGVGTKYEELLKAGYDAVIEATTTIDPTASLLQLLTRPERQRVFS